MFQNSTKGTALWLLAATVGAMIVIVIGALFLIAPVWQLQTTPAAYTPVNLTAEAVSAPQDGATLLDVNQADAEDLMVLPGIGPAKAAAIVAYREEHGPFSALADLDKVDGISARMTQAWVGLAFAGEPDTDTH